MRFQAVTGADQFSDTQESSPDTATDTSYSNYFKAQADQPVLDNSSSLPFLEKDLAEADEKLALVTESRRYR